MESVAKPIKVSFEQIFDKNIAAGKIICERELSSKQLNRENKYSYCPKCAYAAKRQFKQDWMLHLQSLFVKNFKILVKTAPTKGFIDFEKRYFCPNCKILYSENEILEEYMKYYTAQRTTDDTLSKFVDLRDEARIRREFF